MIAPPRTHPADAAPAAEPPPPWSVPVGELFLRLGSSADGLSAEQAARRRRPAEVGERPWRASARLALTQIRSPAVLLLVVAGVLAAFLGDRLDAVVILVVVLVGAALGFHQEHRAAGAMQALLGRLKGRATVLRAGAPVVVAEEEVVPGDVLLLSAGTALAADAVILESSYLYVDEAALTGESFPAEKRAGTGERASALFAGTHVVSGEGRALVHAVGRDTALGAIARKLGEPGQGTSFERGLRQFGYLLLQLTLVMVVTVMAASMVRGRPALEALLFTLALAVGLAPELLPAIVSVTLARGADRMSRANVLVRRLSVIEEFGGMTLLCVDKTGTLTEGTLRLSGARGADGGPGDRALFYAYLNGSLQSAYANPLDAAIRASRSHDLSGYRKLGELPYDFTRKRLSVLVDGPQGPLLVTKGALERVLESCDFAATADGSARPLAVLRGEIEADYARASRDGLRCVGVAIRSVPEQPLTVRLERGMTFLGWIAVEDPPRPDAPAAIAELLGLGVRVKMLTGDNRLVAESVARRVGLSGELLPADQLRRMSDAALLRRAPSVAVFAELDPNDKERILLALRRAGETVGFLGDGINDAAALQAADVGISVDSAADVARRAASVVLMEKSLAVLAVGVREGRAAFSNTLKYMFITMSANFGNMFSMAVASLFSTFMPLLPRQILLINTLSDLPAMAIATDHLDAELTAAPRRWDVRYVRDFMVVFGIISSVFDLLTFLVLYRMRVDVTAFRTAWFLESMATELLILLAIRTSRPVLRSLPGAALCATTLLAAAATAGCVWIRPAARLFGFGPVPVAALLAMGAVVAGYLMASEVAKRWFYAHHRLTPRTSDRRGGVSALAAG